MKINQYQIEQKICDTCGKSKNDVLRRDDNGLKCGKHCNDCWNKMINQARSKSW